MIHSVHKNCTSKQILSNATIRCIEKRKNPFAHRNAMAMLNMMNIERNTKKTRNEIMVSPHSMRNKTFLTGLVYLMYTASNALS